MSAVDEIIEKVSGLTVLELAECIKKMEEKFGVSAAAAVAVAAPAAGGGANGFEGGVHGAMASREGSGSGDGRPTVRAHARRTVRLRSARGPDDAGCS